MLKTRTVWFVLLLISSSLDALATALIQGPDLNLSAYQKLLDKNPKAQSFAHFQWLKFDEPDFQSESLDLCLSESDPEACRLAEGELLKYPLSSANRRVLQSLPHKSDFLKTLLKSSAKRPYVTKNQSFFILRNGEQVGLEALEKLTTQTYHWSFFSSHSLSETFIGSSLEARKKWNQLKPLVVGNCSQFALDPDFRIQMNTRIKELQQEPIELQIVFTAECERSLTEADLIMGRAVTNLPLSSSWSSLRPKNYLVPAALAVAFILGYLNSQGKKIEITSP